jgi:hypothetical protein
MGSYINPKLIPAFQKRAIAGYREWTAPVRLLPDFIIIGGNRCGTAALYEYLCGHPCFIPSSHREVHFFERHFTKGLSWYQSHFPSRLYKYYATRMAGQRFVTGEATTYYIFHPHAPRRIKETVPQAKLIALLRNPVDRAYAQYHQKIRKGHEKLSFEAAIEAEPERLRGEREKMLAFEAYNSYNYRHYSYLTRGIYVDQIAHWLTLFPNEQLLILCSEDLRRDPAAVLKKVLEFLHLSPWQPKVQNNYGQAEYPKMDSRMRSRLREYFQPHNERLYEFVGRDFGWNR